MYGNNTTGGYVPGTSSSGWVFTYPKYPMIPAPGRCPGCGCCQYCGHDAVPVQPQFPPGTICGGNPQHQVGLQDDRNFQGGQSNT